MSSSEAVSSTYPVKPRNYTKLPKKDELLLQSKIVPHSHIDIGAGMSMNDAVEFMKAVEMARSDVFEGEKERENLEIRYQVSSNVWNSIDKFILTNFLVSGALLLLVGHERNVNFAVRSIFGKKERTEEFYSSNARFMSQSCSVF